MQSTYLTLNLTKKQTEELKALLVANAQCRVDIELRGRIIIFAINGRIIYKGHTE
jgi:hypothetical protein